METNNKMDTNKVSELLERYFDAQTTLEEEESLRLYFSQPDIDVEYQKYAPLFNYFSQEIEEINSAENSVGVKTNKTSFFSYKNLYFRSFSLTAAAAMAVFTYILWPPSQKAVELMIDGVKINNEQLAISKTDAHMAKVNSMMNLISERTSSLNKLDDINKALSAVTGIGELSSEEKKLNKY